MRGVTGVYDMTPDSRPLLGEIPEIGGTLRVRGIFRHGIQDFSRDWTGDE
jgi:glycine/D-amino acid oxidase-like deaminating enzyme